MIIKENVKNINLKWIYIITGTFLMAIAYKSIYDSAGMVTGGISGISIIIRRLSLIAKESWKSGWFPQSGIPIWFTNIILDIPLFIWAYCKKGIDYIKDTLAADALLTFFMAVLPADTRVDVSYLKTAIIGGIMAGAFVFGIRVTMYAILAIVITTFIAEFIIRWHMKVKSFGDVSED